MRFAQCAARRLPRGWFGGLGAVLLASMALNGARAAAQPLADKVPADAILYVGWTGTDTPPAGYDQSHLKAVIEASQVRELMTDLWPRVLKRIEAEPGYQNDPMAREIVPVLLSVGELICRKNGALYLGPMDYSNKQPQPRVAVLLSAGKDAAGLAEKVTKFAKMVPEDAGVRVRVQVWPGDVVAVSNFDFPEKFGDPLTGRRQFKEAIKQGRPEPAFALFFDAEKVLAIGSLAVNAGADAKTKNIFQKALEVTGITGLNRVLVTAGFDGKDWGTQTFIEAPEPRRGLLKTLLESEPITDDLLKWAPRSSTWVMATKFDADKLVGDLRAAAIKVDPNAGQMFDQVLAEFKKQTEVDLRQDLLAALGDGWIAYNSQETGQGALGLVLVNPLRDAAKAEKALGTLEKLANQLLAQAAGDNITLAFQTTKAGDLTIHYMGLPVVSPCWAIKNGNLYVALYPQILLAATEHAGAAGTSVLANEDFTAFRKRLGVEKPISLGYLDLRKLAPRGYQLVLLLQRGVLGMGDLLGVPTPPMVLPTLDKLKPHLGPVYGATWTDDEGWHARTVTPFPGAALLGGEQTLLAAGGPLGLGLLVPAVTRARHQAQQAQGMNHLKQIGLGVHMYATDNNGNLPPDLGSMLKYVGSARVFVSPHRAAHAAVPAGQGADAAAWINQNADYVYVGAGKKLATIPRTADYVLAYEKPELAQRGMIAVLYADGHVTIWPVQMVLQALEGQK